MTKTLSLLVLFGLLVACGGDAEPFDDQSHSTDDDSVGNANASADEANDDCRGPLECDLHG